MLRQEPGFDSQTTWRNSRRSAAVLAEHILREVVPVVVVEVGFYTPQEIQELLEQTSVRPRVVHVTLHASFDVVQARVMADQDPRRVASKIPTVLKQLYEEYQAAVPFLKTCGPFLDVSSSGADEVGAAIAALVIEPQHRNDA